MSAQPRTRKQQSSTTTTSVHNEHVLPLSLLAAALESAVSVTAGQLYVVKIGKRREIVEVVKGRILGTTKPEWIYGHIRELIRICNDNEWIIYKLESAS